ncbi:MAG: IS1-like element transposase [Methylobacter sp.]|nr:IS1-like element transposase [Methylococcales bacterium]MDD5112626.1 IS1-like element transposase [Methylobacter sp.]
MIIAIRPIARNLKRQVVEMAINGSGIRDTGRILGINKKHRYQRAKKQAFCEAEMDGQWSYVAGGTP